MSLIIWIKKANYYNVSVIYLLFKFLVSLEGIE